MKEFFKFLLGAVSLSLLLLACVYYPTLSATPALKEASFYHKLDHQQVQCDLCPHSCIINPGKRGFCGVRENQGGTLYTLVYAQPVSITNDDPIEKKPLFHFLPGVRTFSVATVGCNLHCKFCQNWEISQRLPEEITSSHVEPQELVAQVIAAGLPVIAYTYTEPTIFYEYMLETAKLCKAKGIRNIMHSSGYIQEQPLRQLAPYLDAANIDLKGFTEDYYVKMTDATLAPVLRSLEILRYAGVHLEITTLIVPGGNDNEQDITKMCLWIKEHLGADTPLHFSRFYPMYKLLAISPTPVATLAKARQIALDCGLRFVYIGNVAGNEAENTYCPHCKHLLIERRGYFVLKNDLRDGCCPLCGEKIAGVWS